MQQKRKHYEILIDKMHTAHSHEFYLESLWIAYSILEDRLLSALKKSGGATYSNGRPIRMLGEKVQEQNSRKQNDNLLAAYFKDELMQKLHNWKERRNNLMHELADSTKTINELNKEMYILSMDSESMVKDICNSAMLLKKHREKSS